MTTTIADVQASLSAIVVKMMEKGLPVPKAQITLNADGTPYVILRWENKTKAYNYDDKSFFSIKSVEEGIQLAHAFVDGLPSIEERKFTQFQQALANAVEIGRDNGIDVEFVNPLSALVLKLSENALMAPKAS